MVRVEPEQHSTTYGVAYFFLEYANSFGNKISKTDVERYLNNIDFRQRPREVFLDILFEFAPNFHIIRDCDLVILLLQDKQKNLESVYITPEFLRNVSSIQPLVIKGLTKGFSSRKKEIKIPCELIESMYKDLTKEKAFSQFQMDFECWSEIYLSPYSVGRVQRGIADELIFNIVKRK